MRKLAVTLLLAIMIMVCTVIPVWAENASVFGDSITTSMTEVEKYFNITNTDNVSVTTEDGMPVIYMQSADTGHWIISKDAVDFSEFTYTVDLAGGQDSGTELSVFIGADPRFLNGIQVYITKRGKETVSVQGAIRKAGLYEKIMDEAVEIENCNQEETYFRVQLYVSGSDMDVYVNGIYVNSIYIEKGFEGRVGVRCSSAGGDLRIKELALVEGSIDIEADNATEEPAATDVPADPTEKPADPTDVPSEPTASTVPTTAPTSEPVNPTQAPLATDSPATQQPDNDSQGLSMVALGGIILGIVAVICLIAVIAFILVKKKAK
ncbi:MAG: hypothetical protein E7385_06140 [Ruminococcaceae bacterium]|nr:hypothetical protein [Oscillospiraceae bacterium]